MINHVPILFKQRLALSLNICWLYYWLILVAMNLYLTFVSKSFTTVAQSSHHSQLRKTLKNPNILWTFVMTLRNMSTVI